MIRPATPIDAAAVADHYDDLDRLYREIWGEHVHHGLWLRGDESPERAVRQLVDHVATRAGIVAGARVCDVGCGYGATARQLSRERGAQVTGLTLSRAQRDVACALQRPDDRVSIRLGDWLRNGLPPDAFDAAVAIESSEHIADKSACFAEARRVLRPGGRFVVCAWLAAERPSDWQVRLLLEPICREGRLPGMGSATEYRRWLHGAGLELLDFEDLTAQVARTWGICIRRTLGRLAHHREVRRYVLSATARNRVFLLTLFRIRLAYATGAMRYGLFVARRP